MSEEEKKDSPAPEWEERKFPPAGRAEGAPDSAPEREERKFPPAGRAEGAPDSAPEREERKFPPAGRAEGVPDESSKIRPGVHRPGRGRRIAWGLARLSVGAGLLVYVASTGGFKIAALEGLWDRWWWLILGLAFQVPVPFIAAARWTIVLRTQEISITYWRAFQINMIGRFFANFLPGGITAGADVVRGYYIARSSPRGRRGEAAATVLIDRFLGFGALTTLMVVVLTLNAGWIAERNPGILTAAITGVAVMVLALITLVMLGAFAARRSERTSATAERKGGVSRFMARLGAAMVLYRRNRAKLLGASAISVGDHTCSILSATCFGLAVGVTGLGLLQFFVLIPMGMIGNAIPLGPQGMGTYQLMQGKVFGAFGLAAEQGAWLALLWMLARMLVGMAGIIPYIRGQREMRAAAAAGPSGGPAANGTATSEEGKK